MDMSIGNGYIQTGDSILSLIKFSTQWPVLLVYV